jgi:hypothetical protein
MPKNGDFLVLDHIDGVLEVRNRLIKFYTLVHWKTEGKLSILALSCPKLPQKSVLGPFFGF